MNTRVCTRCKEDKPVKEFGKDSSTKSGLKVYCKVCRNKEYREKYKENPGKRKDYLSKYCKEHPEKYGNWARNNPDKVAYFRRIRDNERYRNDSVFRVKRLTRGQILSFFKRSNTPKNDLSSIELLGVNSYEEATEKLLKTLPEGYTKDNFYNGDLEIDHIVPLSWFNILDEEELKKAWNISNLQLLTKEENLKKSNKYIGGGKHPIRYEDE